MIRLSKSCIGERELAAVSRVLSNSFLGMGPEVASFETELAAFIGVPEIVCVNTGTSAIHLALQAIGVGPGDEVLAPSLTYVATFQAISATGAKAVACDVDEAHLTLDVEDAKKRISSKTKAIVFVHYASCAGTLDAIYQLAREYNLRVIEDAAHAFGCKHQNKLIGSFGDITCFSFDGIKNITSGEGGAISTRDQAVIQKIKAARTLGVQAKENDFDVQAQGWRYHMSDLFAAIGREQLKRLYTELGPRRVLLAKRYQEQLARLMHLPQLTLPLHEIIPHIYPIRVHREKRDELREALRVAQIQTGLHYKPNHLLSYYRSETPLPVTEALYQELLTLPLHPDINIEEQDRIIEVVQQCLRSP
jgi:dTDP-4-amino-4,6-dideoxygalactose transaminase